MSAEASGIRRRSLMLSAVDRKSQVHLKLDEDLFKPTEAGKDIPIGSIGGDTPFYNLQIRGKLFESNEIVLEDGTNDSVVALVERKYLTDGYKFLLYSIRLALPGQEPSNVLKYGVKLYSFGTVTEEGDVLKVVREGETESKFKLEPEGNKYVIKKAGVPVASMTPGEGDYYGLDIDQEVDPILLICLAAIADEQKKKTYRGGEYEGPKQG